MTITEITESNSAKKSLAFQVNETFLYCLNTEKEQSESSEGEDRGFQNGVVVSGIVHIVELNFVRLEESKEKIKNFISEMSPTFDLNTIGGMSFLNLCIDKHGNHWGEHINCEELLILAMGLKLGGYCIGRNYWELLPGKMPYVWFDFNEDDKQNTP